MTKIKKLAMVALLFLSAGFVGLVADEDLEAEMILMDCALEAQERGYDTESDAFADKFYTAWEKNDNATLNKICPKTNKKFH